MRKHIVSAHPWRLLFVAGLLMALVWGGCSLTRELVISGKTMGTTYRIKVVAGWFTGADDLQQEIDARLAQINRSMSTYDPDSEISRFNGIATANTPMTPSRDFLHVMRTAAEIHRLTQGAWDGTLDPLINLWGFGRKKMAAVLPDEAAIQAALDHVGFARIRIHEDGRLSKQDPAVTLDLASIAKGYGVDEVARLLGEKGFADFLVEIGGEVYAHGYRKDGSPWRVGINRPEPDAALNAVYLAFPLTDRAMATSGDYRNFIRIGEQLYSHVLDPRSGRPVANRVVSATVVAPNCTVADGLATALMVMGPVAGVALVDRLEGVECLIVVKAPDGSLRDHPSSGFFIE